VKGPRCRACGLLYAEEAPQMVEFRHDSALAAAVEE
jgi:rubredoxin